MDTRAHPTHHAAYRPQRAAWAVGIGLAGVFICVFGAMLNTRESVIRFALKASVLWTGALAFAGGTIVACVIEVGHRFGTLCVVPAAAGANPDRLPAKLLPLPEMPGDLDVSVP